MTEPAAPAPPEVEKDGQRLRHTTAPEARARRRRIVSPRPQQEEKPDRMAEVIARHPEEPDPSEAEHEDVEPPPMEPRPELREEMTATPIALTDEPQPPRTFDDLMSFDLGADYFVHVVRKEPKALGGVRCDGDQKPIRQRMSSADFAKLYGGLTYELTLYGPPKRGIKFDPSTGNPIVRPLTKPIRVTMPGVPPNLQMAIGFEEDEDMTTPVQAGNGRRLGTATTADARIHETDLEHAREMDTRRERQRREREDERRQAERERRREEASSAEAMASMHSASVQSQADLFRTVSDQQNAMLKAIVTGRPGASSEEQRYLHESIRQVQQSNQDYVNRLNDNHAAALERLHTGHAEEIKRLTEQHRAELTRLQDQVVGERTRSEQIVRDAERQFGDRVREAERRADKEVSDARRDASERIDAARRDASDRLASETARHTDRHEDLKLAQERELKARDAKWEMQLASERSGFDARMAVKDSEIKMMREEMTRLRAENAKPIHERVREITETAEALGMTRGGGGGEDEPQSWQQMLYRLGGSMIENLPQIVASAGDTVAKLRSGGTPAQQQQYVRQQQTAMTAAAVAHPIRNLPFALDGEDDFQPGLAAPAVGQTILPVEAPMVSPPLPAPAAQRPPEAALPITPPVAQAPSIAPPAASVPPPAPPAAAAPAAPAPPAPVAAPPPTMDPYVLQYQEAFEKAMAAGASPEEVAQKLLEQFGGGLIGQVTPLLSPPVIRAVLQRNGRAASPLCRREGQRYLAAVKAAIDNLTKKVN